MLCATCTTGVEEHERTRALGACHKPRHNRLIQALKIPENCEGQKGKKQNINACVQCSTSFSVLNFSLAKNSTRHSTRKPGSKRVPKPGHVTRSSVWVHWHVLALLARPWFARSCFESSA